MRNVRVRARTARGHFFLSHLFRIALDGLLKIEVATSLGRPML